jgi:hypothetical protein
MNLLSFDIQLPLRAAQLLCFYVSAAVAAAESQRLAALPAVVLYIE